MSEATYGERLHEDRTAAERRLIAQVASVVEGGGRALIPVFAVGRAQEVLLILKRALRRKELPPVPVIVDGMVRSVCNVYGRHERYASRALSHEIRRAGHPFYTDLIQAVDRVEDRKKALTSGSCVIVASSGMLSGGASIFYARELVKSDRDAILITGYQDEESPGRALLNLAQGEGSRQIKLGEDLVDVECRVEKYGLSAHADRVQMISLLESLRPRTVVLVHGDEEARRTLARGLSCRDVVLPRNGDRVERSHARRASRTVLTPPDGLDEIDLERARNLLGPPGEAPLRAARIAEAWYGRRVEPAMVDRLVERLEQSGLVRRDDHQRSRLWVLGPGETDLFGEEEQDGERLKLENPKGRLLELCMRLRVDPPRIDRFVEGGHHVVRMSLNVEGGTIHSGDQRAVSRKTAEQRAARVVLSRMEEMEAEESIQRVDDETAARLKLENPKGKLLEWCMAKKLGAPEFEQRAVPEGFRVRTVLGIGNDEIVTAWYEASARKVAEQSAASELLERLKESPEARTNEVGDENRETDSLDSEAEQGGGLDLGWN